MGRLGSLNPERLRRIALATRGERGVLPDDALAQPLFHVHQFLDFALEQAADGNAGPLADDLGDFFFADFFLQHGMVFLQLGKLVLRGLEFFFRRGQLAVADFGDAGKVAGALIALLFRLQAFDCFLLLADAPNGLFLGLPVGLERVGLLAQGREFLLNLREALARVRRRFPCAAPGARFPAA